MAVLERVLDDSLVLLDEYGAGGVDNVAARFGLVIQAINCFEEQLALYGRAALDVDRILGGLDGHVLGYDARAAARRVQQDTIEVLDVLDFAETQQRLRNIFTPDKKELQINSNESKYLADLAAIQVAHNRVGDSQAVQVADDRVETLAVGVVLLDEYGAGGVDNVARLTPRLMSAWARSRLRVFSVFVRMVTGRCTSFASSSSTTSISENKLYVVRVVQTQIGLQLGHASLYYRFSLFRVYFKILF